MFGRRLDAHGTPRAEVELLSDAFVLGVRSLSAAPIDGASGIGTCFRIGGSDLPGWQLVRRDARIDVVRAGLGACGAPMFASRGRVIAAWAHDYEIEVGSAAPDGSDLAEGVFDPGERIVGGWSSAIDDRVGVLYLVVEGERRELYFAGFDLRGALRAGPTLVPIEYDSYPFLVGTREGWLVIMPGRRHDARPARRALLDRSGVLVAEPTTFADGRVLPETELSIALVHHPEAPQIAAVWQEVIGDAAELRVELLDERGEPERAFREAAPGVVGSPDVIFAGDRLLVTWHDIAPDRTPNRVFVRELGCAR